jgi:hypothetical protein
MNEAHLLNHVTLTPNKVSLLRILETLRVMRALMAGPPMTK